MHFTGVREHVLHAILDWTLVQVGHAAVAVKAQEHAFAGQEVVRRIRELAERQIRVEMAAKDASSSSQKRRRICSPILALAL